MKRFITGCNKRVIAVILVFAVTLATVWNGRGFLLDSINAHADGAPRLEASYYDEEIHEGDMICVREAEKNIIKVSVEDADSVYYLCDDSEAQFATNENGSPLEPATNENGRLMTPATEENGCQVYYIYINTTKANVVYNYKLTAMKRGSSSSLSFSVSVLDTESPEFDITYDKNTWTNEQVDVVVNEIHDATSGVKSLTYKIGDNDEVTEKVNTDSFTIKANDLPDGDYNVSVYVTDVAGNVSVNKYVRVMKDTVAPSFNATYDFEGILTNENCDITVSDIYENTSEISSISYKVGNGADTVVDKNSDSFTIPADELYDGEYTVIVKATDKAGNELKREIDIKKDTTGPSYKVNYDSEGVLTNEKHDVTVSDINDVTSGVKSISYKVGKEESIIVDKSNTGFIISADKLYDGEYDVVINVIDNAGMNTEKKVRIKKDTVGPEFAIAYNSEGVLTSEKLDITVSDINDVTSAVSNIVYQIGEGEAVTVDKSNKSFVIPADELYDGIYFVTVKVTDAAGNETEKKIDIRKDVTGPAFKITYDSEGKLTKEELDIVVSDIKDATSKVSSIVYQIGNNNPVTVDSNKVDFTIPSDQLDDGQYYVTVKVTDEVGNATEQKVDVKKDTLPPEFNVCYEKDNKKFDGVWTDEEINILVDGITDASSIKSISYKIGNKEEVYLSDKNVDSFTINASELYVGDYIVNIKIVDELDNKSEKNINVKKDKEDPEFEVIYVKDSLNYDGIWANDDIDISVQNIKDDYKVSSISYKIGNKTPVSIGKDNESFVISSTDLDDGDYNVTISVTDKSGKTTDKTVHVMKDKEKPVFKAIYNNKEWSETQEEGEWVNEDLNIAVTDIADSTDKSEVVSGIKEIKYSFTGEESVIADSSDAKSLTIDLKEGDYKVTITVTDYAGNVTTKTVSVKKDITKPDVVVEYNDKEWSEKIEESEWINKNLDINISGINDSVSGVEEIAYKIGDNEVNKLENPSDTNEFSVIAKELAEGDYIVEITVKDIAGNIAIRNVTIKKDLCKPEFTVKYKDKEWSEEVEEGEWTNNNLDIVVDGIVDSVDKTDDVAGVKVITYSIDGGKENTISNPTNTSEFTIKSKDLKEGDYKVVITVTDDAGNSTSKTVSVKKDITNPSFVVKYNNKEWGEKEEEGKWVNKNLNISVSDIVDAVSDVKEITYSIDGVKLDEEIPVNTTEFTIDAKELKEGNYKVKIMVTDNADNTTTKIVSVMKDLHRPEFDVSYNDKEWSENVEEGQWTNSEKDIYIKNISSGESEIKSISYIIGSDKSKTVDNKKNSFVIKSSALKNGDYKVKISVTNNANVTVTKTVSVMKDTVKPEFKYSYDAENKWSNDKQLKITVSDIADKTSGINVIKYKIGYSEEKSIKNTSKSFTIKSAELPEGEYFVLITVADKANNSFSQKIRVKKDTTKPTFEWDVIDDNATNKAGGWSNNKGIKVAIKEIHDPDGNVKKAILGKDSGISSGISSVVYKIGDQKETTPKSKKAFNITNLPEGDYDVVITVTDNAGNKYRQKVNIKKDTKKPSADLYIGTGEDEEKWNKWNDNISYRLYYKEPKAIKIVGNDDNKNIKTSGIKNIKVLNTDVIYRTTDELRNASGWKNYKNAYYSGKQVNTIVYVWITDNAGNEIFINSDGIVFDAKSPVADITKPEITITSSPAINDIYGDSVDVTFTVKDPDMVTSGLGVVTYSIESADLGIKGIEDGYGESVDVLKKVVGKKAVTTESDLSKASVWTKTVRVDKKNFNANDVRFIVNAEDNAGNKARQQVLNIEIDTTAPVVTVTSTDKIQGNYNGIYKDSRTMNITVQERNLDVSDLKLIITKDGNTISSPVLDNASLTVGTGNHDNDVYSIPYVFDDDGDYTFTVECTDKAGNKCTNVTYVGDDMNSFTIDKTDPVMNVTPNNEGSRCYENNITYKIVINEHNFDESDAKIIVKTFDDNSVADMSKYSLGQWVTSGDEHTIEVKFGSDDGSSDGDYKLEVDYSDKSGRDVLGFKSNEITIDNKKPEIKLLEKESIVSNDYKTGLYKDDLSIKYECTDINFDNNNSYNTVIFTNLENSEDYTYERNTNYFDVVTTEEGLALTIKDEKVKDEKDGKDIYGLPDGRYKIYIKMYDKAGNYNEVVDDKFYICRKPAIATWKEGTEIWSREKNTNDEENTDDSENTNDTKIKKDYKDINNIEVELKSYSKLKCLYVEVEREGAEMYFIYDDEKEKLYISNKDIRNEKDEEKEKYEEKDEEKDKYITKKEGDGSDTYTLLLTKDLIKEYFFEKKDMGEIPYAKIDFTLFADDYSANNVNDTQRHIVLDQEAPKVTIYPYQNDATGEPLVNGKSIDFVENSQKFKVVISDNYEIKEDINIKIGKDDIKELSSLEEFEHNSPGQVSFVITLNESRSRQAITISATDAAGNETGDYNFKVLVSTSLLARILNNPPLLAATIAGTVGVIGLIIFVVIRRKKRKQNNSKAGESK